MMTARFLLLGMIATLGVGLVLSGCLTKPSAKASFYMLSSPDSSASERVAGAGSGQTVIVVETVEIPQYLNRKQIVTSTDGTEYEIDEFHQWAEPLDESMTRVIAGNLSNLFPVDSVQILPAVAMIPSDYQVDIKVLRLDGKLGDQVTLTAQWAILSTETQEVVSLRKSEYREEVEDTSYKDFVLAQSRTVDRLSQDIARELQAAVGAAKAEP
jgi:uncharacterized lipoprotein YmbA